MSAILIPASSNNQRSPWRLPMSEHCARLVTLHLVFSRPRLEASPVPCGLRTLDRISALTSSTLAHLPKRLRCNVSSRFAVPPTCSRKCNPKSFRKFCCRTAGHDQCACAPCAFVYMYRLFPLYLMMRPHVEMKNKSMYLPVLLDVDWAVVVFFHRRIALVGLLSAGVVARLGLVHMHVLTSCLRRLP
jgi:hypothetical protein